MFFLMREWIMSQDSEIEVSLEGILNRGRNSAR